MSSCVLRLLRIGRNVADINLARAFYCDALGFSPINEHSNAAPTWTQLPGVCDAAPRSVRLHLGDQEIELTAFDSPGAPYPLDSNAADLWFQHCAIVVDDMDAAYARLLRHGGTSAISRDGPQTLPPSSGGVTAFKFRDPDGHPLELIAFAPGSGDPLWQRARSNGPTLGIDHSAISVASADRSIAFYSDLLGLTLSVRQINRGPQQEQLDGLAHVTVDVVALQPADVTKPHIELLGYCTPHGRALPNMGVRDIAADRLILQVRGLSALLETVAHENIVAADAVDGSHVALLCDPDGHLLVLTD